MGGLVAIFGVVIAWDAYAVKRERETISSACRRTLTASRTRRVAFIAGWTALAWHLVRRAA